MEESIPTPIPGTSLFIQTAEDRGLFSAHLTDAGGKHIDPDFEVANCSTRTNAMILLAFRTGRLVQDGILG